MLITLDSTVFGSLLTSWRAREREATKNGSEQYNGSYAQGSEEIAGQALNDGVADALTSVASELKAALFAAGALFVHCENLDCDRCDHESAMRRWPIGMENPWYCPTHFDEVSGLALAD